MDKLKAEIKNLLAKSILVKAERRESLLQKLDSFDESQLQDLQKLLLGASKKQDEFVLQAVKNNPNFLSKVKGFVRGKFKKVREEKEDASREEEKSILDNLDQELASMVLTSVICASALF